MKQQNILVLTLNQLAICYGGILKKAADISARLSKVLERTTSTEKGVVYIQSNESDNSKSFQSYKHLTQKAKRILASLIKLSLKK